MTHYEVLGVPAHATTAEIRQAYVRLARVHHPDFHVNDDAGRRDDAARRMKAINEAWDVLQDQRRRLDYDRRIGIASSPVVAGFQPFDDTDDDDVAWMVDDDGGVEVPLTGGRRAAIIAPMGLVAAAITLFSVGLVVSLPALVVLAAACLIGAGLMFVLVPLFAMSEAKRNSPP